MYPTLLALTMIFNRAFFVCVGVLVALPVGAQVVRPVRDVSAGAFMSDVKSRSSQQSNSSERHFAVRSADVTRTFVALRDVIVHEFPIGGSESADVTLTRTRAIVDANTEVWVGTASGPVRAPVPNIVSYRGGIVGEPGSRVFINVVNGELIGLVQRGNGNAFTIGPTSNASVAGEHVLVPDGDFKFANVEKMMRCEADKTPRYNLSKIYPFVSRSTSADTTKLLETQIAVEADNFFYTRTGGTVAKSTAYIAAMFAMVSSIYEDEVNVTFYLPWIKVWSTTDPYSSNGNAYVLYDSVPTYWQAHYANVSRDIAHVLTSSSNGGGGKAFRGNGIDGGEPVICSKQYGYGCSSPRGVLSYPTFAFTYDVYIVAHEIGHNFGARHTHDCWWGPALDTCLTLDDIELGALDACYSKPVTPRPNPGTIMSYCTAANYKFSGNQFDSFKVAMRFSPRVAEVMRQEAELSACLTEPPDPTVILTYPRGADRKYYGDSTIDIVWTSARVATVNLSFTDDNGSNWFPIGQAAAADRKFAWTLPRSCSKFVMVRIEDASNAQVADTSLLPFEISSPTVNPSILGDTVFCSGDSTILSSADEYSLYNWSTGQVTRSIIVKQAGNYSITVTDSLGCMGTSTIMRVRVNTPSVPTFSRSNDTLTSSPASAYQWYFNATPISGQTSRKTIAKQTGLYRVMTTDSNGCRAVSSDVFVNLGVGVDDEVVQRTTDASGIDIEAKDGELMVRTRINAVSGVCITIFNNMGQKIGSLPSTTSISSDVLTLRYNTTLLPSGIYFVHVQSDGNSVVRRVIIVRK